MKTQYKTRILLLASLLYGCGLLAADKKPSMPQMPSPAVTVEPAQQILETTPKEYIGSVTAIEEVDLPSRISGTITGIKFKEGSLVKKGDLLFTIEDTSYQAKAMAGRAKVAQLDAELKYAQSNYIRQKTLASSEAVSKSNYEDAQRLVDLTRAKYEQNKAELLDVENDLSYTNIYAPITGRIGEVKHTVGNFVSPASSFLAKIVSVDPVQVKFAISERDFINLFKNINTPNKNLIISLRLANGELFPHTGKIAFVDNVVDNNTGTISIWTEFTNPELKLMPGGYVNVLLAEKLNEPLVGVKASAILTDNRGNSVYVVTPDRQVERRNVKLGEVVGNMIVITHGLKVGEQVITDGTHKVIPGVPVNPIPASPVKE